MSRTDLLRKKNYVFVSWLFNFPSTSVISRTDLLIKKIRFRFLVSCPSKSVSQALIYSDKIAFSCLGCLSCKQTHTLVADVVPLGHGGDWSGGTLGQHQPHTRCPTVGTTSKHHSRNRLPEDLSSFCVCTLQSPRCTWGRYHGRRRLSSDDNFHSPTVIPPSALDKPSIMKRCHRRRTCSHTSPHRSPTMVTPRSSSSSSAIDSRAGQIFSPVDATKPAVR